MLNRVWGTTSGIAQFVMMACLIATSNLQMCIPQFIMPAKGTFAMVALLTLVDDMPSSSPPQCPEHRRSQHHPEIAHIAQDHPRSVLRRTGSV